MNLDSLHYCHRSRPISTKQTISVVDLLRLNLIDLPHFTESKSRYEAHTLFGLGMSNTDTTHDTYNYTELCDFIKLLIVSAC